MRAGGHYHYGITAECNSSCAELDPHSMYSGTSLIRTPEMRTPRFNGHFAQVRNLSHSLLYIFTSEMRTSRYSV